MRNDAGELATSDEAKLDAWVEHYARLLNVEFDWPSDKLPEVAPIAGPPPSVSTDLIHKAISKIKCGKAAGPSGIIAEMLKSSGEECVELARQLVEVVFSSGEIPADWEESIILLTMGGELHLTPLQEQGWGTRPWQLPWPQAHRPGDEAGGKGVKQSSMRNMVNIDEMQFGFVPGRGTTDAIFTVRQLQEKHIAANKRLYFSFVDLEKAFDRVPRKVLWWALRSLGVKEWAVRVVQGMYTNARSRVRVNGQYSEEFGMQVGVHQGSVLSPLLFILVQEALSREFRKGVPWELLYADDLILIEDSLEWVSD